MKMPEGWFNLLKLPTDDEKLKAALVLMKEMAEALNLVEYTSLNPEANNKVEEVLEKFREWK